MKKKKLNITVGVVAYNLSDELDELLRSIQSPAGNDIHVHLYCHSSIPRVVNVCKKWQKSAHWKLGVDVTYHGEVGNRGLSRSWSRAMIEGFERENSDVVILPNDDIVFSPGDIDEIARYAYEHPDKGAITSLGYHDVYGRFKGFGYSLFAVNPIAWERIGCFDANFFPIYFEDCDWGRRLNLAGLHLDECKSVAPLHYGSLSWQVDGFLEKQNTLTGQANQAYYAKKWGTPDPATPTERQYQTPFDNPTIPLRIPAEDWDAPYAGWGLDRTDFKEVVKR